MTIEENLEDTTILICSLNETIAKQNKEIQKLKEAIQKIKEEIKQKSDYTKNIWDEYPDEWYAGKCSAYHESLEIIDKYLAEVSECR